MLEFGKELKQKREEMGKSIDEISQKTKINEAYLQAIEEGNFSVLPETFMKLFMKTYAKELNVEFDPVKVLGAEVEEELTVNSVETQSSVEDDSLSSFLHKYLKLILIIVVVIIVIFIAYIVKGYIISEDTEKGDLNVVSAENVDEKPSRFWDDAYKEKADDTSDDTATSGDEIEKAFSDKSVNLRFISENDNNFIIYFADDGEILEKKFNKGDTVEVVADETAEILLGDAKNGEISYNGGKFEKVDKGKKNQYLRASKLFGVETIKKSEKIYNYLQENYKKE